MIESALGLLVGLALGAAGWHAMSGSLEVDALRRSNYRGTEVPTAAGIVVPLVVTVAVAAVALLEGVRASLWGEWAVLAVTALVASAGFGLVGLFDDVVGHGQSGGFRGHLRHLAAGRLTSGSIKLLAGAALGVVVATRLQTADPAAPVAVAVLRDGAIVALAANLVNLFDRRPGRAVKAAAVLFVAALAVARSASLAVPAVGVGAAIGLLWADLRERCMIGDVGANPIGALCGVAFLVAAPSGFARWGVAAVLVALNAASELVSFSRIIDAVPPLRWFDQLGRTRVD